MHLHRFLLGILSVWRLTHLLYAEDGPWNAVVYLRRSVGSGFWGQLLDCFYCLSLWIAVPIAISLGQKLDERILMWPALSAGAILIEQSMERRHGETPAPFFEESEDDYVMLRQKAGTGSSSYPSS